MKKILIVLLSVLFMGCGSNTSLVDSWRDPNTTIAKEQFKKVLVVALVKDETNRRVAENTIVQMDPTLFHPSYDLFVQNTVDLPNEQKNEILKNEGYDGVITMRLVNREKETTYVQGTTYYSGYGGYGGYYGGSYGSMYNNGFSGWYGSYGATYYEPGYYEESTNYFIETNVFSVNLNKLLWSGTTKTVDPDNVSSTVENVMKVVVENMRKDGSLPPKAPKK